MNYVSVNTVGQMDDVGTNTGMKDCSSGHIYLQLHNQGMLFYIPDLSFGGSGTHQCRQDLLRSGQRPAHNAVKQELVNYPVL